MDYDLTNIPVNYDRGRDLAPEMLNLWMDVIESHLEGQTITRILDLGCGTGRFSEGLAVRFGAEVVGIDPSAKMLEQARRKRSDDRVQYERGRAEAIPLLSHAVDLIFMSMSFHHFTDSSLAARECRRVLREQGRVFLRTGTRENIASYPYIPFFPSSRSIIEELLPDGVSVREVFETARLQMVASETVKQTIAPSWAAYAEKLSAGADSVLARLSRQEFEAGLEALRSRSVEVDDRPVAEPIDLFVFR